jgi:hypothetical protein
LVFDGDKIVLDPDQEVQGAVRAVFKLFEQENSAYAVVQRFHQLDLLFPRRSYGGVWNGKLIWGRLTHSRVIGVLANPSYAGTYVFGRYQSCKKIGPTGEICTQSRQMPQDQWRVVIPDHHPGYITWDQFLANRRRLAANRTNSEVLAGPARDGLCLLQGVLLCGVCGRRLSTRYTGNGGLYPSYDCNSRSRDASPLRHCMSLPAKPLDDAIAARLLTAVTPLTIKLALEALTNLEARDKAISAQWHRKIERARYDANLAERRYEEADPSNRLVAGTLEKRWNDAMQRMIELEAEVADFERQAMRSLTPEQKQQILQLGKDFPRLWKAPTTSACDRKRMLRLLIRDITVVKGAEPKLLHLQIRWQGGATETIDVRRQPNRAEATRYPDTFVAKIRTMAEKYDDKEIAARLKGEAQALYVCGGPLATASRVRIATFAMGARLPTINPSRIYLEAGGLISYGVDNRDLFRRAGEFVDKILRGAKPADLPVEQPTKFELVINLTTAKALGLDIPLHLQQRADEVIE